MPGFRILGSCDARRSRGLALLLPRLPKILKPGTALLAAVLLLACGNPAGDRGAEGARPIILLDIDSLRADHLGCYGSSRATSPNIDALAADAVRFEWAFSQAPDTAPAQASLLTGLYPSSHGLVDQLHRLPDEAQTLAEMLVAHGYATAAFVDGGFLSEEFGFAQGFDVYDNSRGEGLATIGPKVLEYLRAHAAEPFLLVVHSYDPHPPYDPPEPCRSRMLEGLGPPGEGFDASLQALEAARAALAAEPPRPLPASDLERLEALYDGEVCHVDSWVGRILDQVRELGLDRRAVIVLASDHGQEFQEHGLLLHDGLYSTVTRVPLLLRLPAGEHAGVVPKIVETVDVVPTLLDLVGVEIPAAVQGASLLPLIRGQGTPPYLAFGERAGGHAFVALGAFRMVLDGATGQAELYNFLEDPLELTDLAAAEPKRVEVLKLHLEAHRQRLADASLGAEGGGQLGQDTLEQLKTLGYVQ